MEEHYFFERIEGCIAVEMAFSEMYSAFAAMFPDAGALWRELALEEENHAIILIIGRGFHRAHHLPEQIAPLALPQIEKLLSDIRAVKKRIASGEMTLQQALELALALEDASAEGYLTDVLSKEDDSEIVSSLRKLLLDEKTHREKIAAFMKPRAIPA